MPCSVLLVRLACLPALLGLLIAASPAAAAPPPNDAPAGAAGFETVSAENGTPSDQQAVADLAEASPDPGIPSCLGSSSFARTVWFRIPESAAPREIAVEATGRTLEVIDLAAFVQPPGAGSPVTVEPNACAGAGAGGSDASEEPTSAIAMRIPAGRAVLVQVGRRGPRSSREDEQALVVLSQTNLAAVPAPAGDEAASAPAARGSGTTRVTLGGATITEEDPAQPVCPSLASVWRRLTPGKTGRRTISADGGTLGTLAVFSGPRPTGDNVLDCVNRERSGELQMRVRARRGKTMWIRLGTDRPASVSTATLRVSNGSETVVDGGPGGSDPTPGGPGAGLPDECWQARAQRARVAGRISGSARRLNRKRRLALRVTLKRSSVCDVDVRLRGPRGRVYAVARAVRLSGRERLRLVRVRRLVPGSYKLKVTALDPFGERRSVRSRVRGRIG